MPKKLLVSLLFLLILISTSVAQNAGNYFIKNYNRLDYKASISNLDIIQDDNGLIYVANYDGVLIYDGTIWKFTPVNNNSAANCLARDENKRVYAGSKEDLGFISPDATGKLQFTSLLDKVPQDVKFSAIRKIVPYNNKLYCLTAEEIIILNEKEELEFIHSNKRPFQFSLFASKDGLYCLQKGNGLIRINDTNTNLVSEEITNWRFLTFLNTLNSKTLIGTFSNGLFELSDEKLIKMSNNVSNYLSESTLSTGTKINHNNSEHFYLGTYKKGIVETTDELNQYSIIDKNSGLQSDIIKSLITDKENGLWAAMQEGVSRIEVYSPWKIWDEDDGLEGTPWDIIKFKETLYIGTTKGLFYLKNGKFLPVQGMNNKVWSLGLIQKTGLDDVTLIAGTEKDLYEIIGDKSRSILSLPGITKLYNRKDKITELYVGYWGGLNKITFENNKYKNYPILSSNNNLINCIAVDSNDKLWASSKFTGIHYTDVTNPSNGTLFNQVNGLHDVNKINFINTDDGLLFTTDKGIYKKFGQANQVKFIRDSSLIKDPINIGVISKAPNSDYFASVINEDRTEHVERFHKVGDEYLRETIPFKRLPEMEIISIYPEENGIVWIAGSEGLFRYDSKVKKDYTLPFNTVISKAAVRDSIIFHGFYPVKVEGSDIPGIGIVQPEDMQPTLTYDDNSIAFEYSATSYEVPEKNQFSYYLENNDRGWSSWSTETKKEYNNLDPGEYTFFVKSKNIYGTEGRLATYKFKVLAPWYQTVWAYALWTVLAGFIVWFITIAYSVRVRTQRKKLQLIVADRTYEVMSQKKEIEHQNHLLKAKNEEISFQKDDIQKKNIQLRESQEEILSMNQKLTELNMYLEKKVEKRTSKIKATLKQLQQINGELDTFVYRASHDLKGPISRINGITSLAKLESPDDINLKYFGLIEDTAKDMEALLSKLAQVHEIINTTPQQEEIDIPTLLSEVRDSVKFLDRGPQTKYTFDLNQIIIVSDHYLLSIIIKNLIENALIFRKATSTEPHHIHISTSATNGMFEIKIKDNGVGIHTPHLNMIFQMFFRGSDKSKGSGLGLYLVKMCIDKLKASIAVESKENEFTEFTISIQNSKNWP